MNPQNSFTRDYRLREHGYTGRCLLQNPEKQGGWVSSTVSQSAVNDDLPSLPWIVSGCLVAVGVFFIWVWLFAILLNPQTTQDTLAVYNADIPISEHNNEHTALSLTPSSASPRRLSGALPDGNGLFSPGESVLPPPTSVSPSDGLQPLSDGAFYTSTPLSAGSQTSELMMLSGVLDNPDVNDGWED